MNDLWASPLPFPGFYQSKHVHPECRPFRILRGNPNVMLFIHGFTGNPSDFIGYVEPYVDAGFDVVVPLVPGHGSHVSLLEDLCFRDLYIPFPPLARHLQGMYREIHVTGLSYGAILATTLALEIQPSSLSFFAPAFFLAIEAEKKVSWMKRLRIHELRARMPKTETGAHQQPTERMMGVKYESVALRPLIGLHDQARALQAKLGQLRMPIFHAHGDQDTTTPIHSNHELLRRSFPADRYTFIRFPGARHVMTLDPSASELREKHLAWLGSLRRD